MELCKLALPVGLRLRVRTALAAANGLYESG